MDSEEVKARRPARTPMSGRRLGVARLGAVGSLLLVGAALLVIVVGSTGSRRSHLSSTPASQSVTAATTASPSTATTRVQAVPILAYHVINVAPPQSSLSPSMYVPVDQFSAQMKALKTAGWHAVTLDQLEAHWTHRTSLGPGKPLVISFDDGYASHYTKALPVLKGLGWVGVENLALGGLTPSDGGLSDSQIRGLVTAGWELDTEGSSEPDLTSLGSSQVSSEISAAKQTLHGQYGVAVNWFSYPSGRYDPTVTAAVQTAGFVGATTLVPGWANAKENRFRLPRVAVTAGTTAAQLLAQIAAAQQSAPPPASHTGG